MNWDQVQKNWKRVSDQVKVTWGKLSEDDLVAIAGRRERFAGLLQERYGIAKDKAEQDLDEFARRLTV